MRRKTHRLGSEEPPSGHVSEDLKREAGTYLLESAQFDARSHWGGTTRIDFDHLGRW